MRKSIKGKVLAVLVFAGVLGISGTSFAKTAPIIRGFIIEGKEYRLTAQEPLKNQKHKPPMPAKEFDKKRPPVSHDKRPPKPDDKKYSPVSHDEKHPPVSKDKKPPKPHSDDKRPPEFDNKKHEPPKGR